MGGVLGPADYLATTRFMARPDDPYARELLPLAGEIQSPLDYYGLALGSKRMREMVDANYWQSLTTGSLKDANFVDTARLMNDIRDYNANISRP